VARSIHLPPGDRGRAERERHDPGDRGGIDPGNGAIDWPTIYGRIVTATGWTFDTINESSFCDIADLLVYWAEEPPTHVILALRYLGQRKKPTSENQALEQLAQAAGLMQDAGVMAGAPQPMPPHLREMAEWAEQQQAKLNKTGRKG
jgi:hypothetical protein